MSNTDKNIPVGVTFSDDPVSDRLLPTDNPRIAALPKLTGESFRNSNTKDHTYTINAKDIRTKALFDYWTFIDLIQMHGGTKNFNQKLHKEMADFVSQTQSINCKNRSRLGLVPRGHYKSTIGTVGYVLWRIYRNPNIRICVGTATKELATTFVREIKQYLEDETLQERVWNNRPHIPGRLVPILDKVEATRRQRKRTLDESDDTEAQDKKIVWRANAVQVLRDVILREPTVVVASVGMTITGLHFDMVILDDVIDRKNTTTPELRAKTMGWINDLESIVDPERPSKFGRYSEILGREFVIWGTRYHKEDYYQHLIDNLDDYGFKLFFRNIYANGTDDSDGYIFPERFNAKLFDQILKKQGVIYFSSQYLNKVVTAEEVIFDASRVKYVSPTSVSAVGEYSKGMVRVHVGEIGHDIRPMLVVDPAISQKKTADYSVVLVGGTDSQRNFFVLDIKYGRWLPDELIDVVYELADKYELSTITLETVAFQAALVTMFKQMGFKKHRPIAIQEYRPRGDKESRIKMYLEPLFKNDMLHLMTWMSNCKELMDEINYFPTVHDDLIDAMAMCVELSVPVPKKKERLWTDSAIDLGNGFIVDRKYGGRLR